ncbi:hypothetical protein KOR42_41110 [Thalassoglobus neptunius]|uniref:Sulfatase n=1 Tax=Thalassoglobus neptunius TaxID=1938619 RepID=A0A5C5WCS2_9PLAN|nr:DUF1501 domain-containing protein [Thalassoglobus neptunius]TWT47913.1 hypothetical protein KOR42_41110 [Thalassoglobus neptunius]
MLEGIPLARRSVLQIGALGLLGKTLSADAGQEAVPPHRSCIFMHLQGGASHIDLFDPKPHAVSEVRGPFQSIETSIPDVRFGELMPHSARIADQLCVIRSMTHKFTNHIAGTYISLTGSENQQDRDREAHGDDFPGPGAVLNYLFPGQHSVPRSVSLPNWLSIPGPSNRMPGQYGGFLGSLHDPFVIEGDPASPNYQPLSLSIPEGLTPPRLRKRLSLTEKLESVARILDADVATRHDHLRQSALELVVDGKVRQALDLSQESDAMRDRYGRNRLGQSLLLARRLVEAGVQFVSFNEFNQKWDTHGNLENRYRHIVPPMDQGFAALVDDLRDRGMLESTLVVNTGEFGRTPVINNLAGRDHWPNVYSTVLAGGGFRPGIVYGESDSKGAEVASHPVSPADLLATFWSQMGIDPTTEIHDRLNRPMQISSGSILDPLIARS